MSLPITKKEEIIQKLVENKSKRNEIIDNYNLNQSLKIPGLIEASLNDNIQFVKLLPGTKAGFEIGWSTKSLDLVDFAFHDGNLGARVGPRFMAVDVDGVFPSDVGGVVSDERRAFIKQRTKEIAAGLVAEAFFPSQYSSDYPRPMIVETASGGFHFYFVNSVTYGDDFSIFNSLLFPSDFEIEELRNQPTNGLVELFTRTNSRQMVLPFSRINGGVYRIVDEFSFTDVNGNIQVLESAYGLDRLGEFEDINKRLLSVFLAHGFQLVPQDEDVDIKVNFDSHQGVKHDIPYYYMDDFSGFILEMLEYMDMSNEKYNFTLALGGYLSHYVTRKSVELLGEAVIAKVHEKYADRAFFKSDKQFLQGLLVSFDRIDDDSMRDLVGGPRCYEYLKSFISKEEFYGRMILYMGNTFSFYPAGRSTLRYNRIIFDQYRNIIKLIGCQQKKDEEGVYHEVDVTQYSALGMVPVRVVMLNNPLDPTDVSFEVTCADVERNLYYYEGSNLEEINIQISNSFFGQTSRNTKQILAQIFQKFAEIHLIQKSERSSVSGIYDLHHNGDLVRYDENGYSVEPVFDRFTLMSAVKLLSKIGDVYPMNKEKFGHICRVGFRLPFTKVLRDYGYAPRYLILQGAGGTLKTTVAELLLSFYDNVRTIGDKANEFGAGSFGSEYQVGEKFGIGGNGFVVNEPGKAFQTPEITEVLKHAIENDVARKTIDAIYPSYQAAIFCTNIGTETSDAIIRRSDIFTLSAYERPNRSDLQKIAALLNSKGRRNSRFRDLRPIGDFMFAYVARHMELFNESLDIDDFAMRLVDALEDELGLDLDWLRGIGTEDQEQTIREEVDDDIVANFKEYFSNSYNRYFRILEGQQQVVDGIMTVDDEADAFSLNNIKILVRRNAFPFIVAHGTKPDFCVFLKGPIKKFYKQEFNMLVNLEAFENQVREFDNPDDPYGFHNGIFTTQNANGKRKNGLLVPYRFLYDLLNNRI